MLESGRVAIVAMDAGMLQLLAELRASLVLDIGAAGDVLTKVNLGEDSAVAGQVLADPEQSAAVEKASGALRRASIADLPPAELLVVLAWLIAVASSSHRRRWTGRSPCRRSSATPPGTPRWP